MYNDCVGISRDVNRSGEEYENKRDVVGWKAALHRFVGEGAKNANSNLIM